MAGESYTNVAWRVNLIPLLHGGDQCCMAEILYHCCMAETNVAWRRSYTNVAWRRPMLHGGDLIPILHGGDLIPILHGGDQCCMAVRVNLTPMLHGGDHSSIGVRYGQLTLQLCLAGFRLRRQGGVCVLSYISCLPLGVKPNYPRHRDQSYCTPCNREMSPQLVQVLGGRGGPSGRGGCGGSWLAVQVRATGVVSRDAGAWHGQDCVRVAAGRLFIACRAAGLRLLCSWSFTQGPSWCLFAAKWPAFKSSTPSPSFSKLPHSSTRLSSACRAHPVFWLLQWHAFEECKLGVTKPGFP